MPEARKWQLTDIAIPQDQNIFSKENKNVNKYIDLANVTRAEHKVKTEIGPLVIGALGSIPKQLKIYIDVIGIANIIGSFVVLNIIGSAQISIITSTARILRDILSL